MEWFRLGYRLGTVLQETYSECQWTIRCKRDYIEIDKNKIEELQDRLKVRARNPHF